MPMPDMTGNCHLQMPSMYEALQKMKITNDLLQEAKSYVNPLYVNNPPGTEIPTLGEDELRLLKAYKNFKTRSPVGAVFKWKTPMHAEMILTQGGSLIADPRECPFFNLD